MEEEEDDVVDMHDPLEQVDMLRRQLLFKNTAIGENTCLANSLNSVQRHVFDCVINTLNICTNSTEGASVRANRLFCLLECL